MDGVNPINVPRNYVLHQVIKAAELGDLSPLETLMGVLKKPYEDQGFYGAAMRPDWAVDVPGCSALSCSS